MYFPLSLQDKTRTATKPCEPIVKCLHKLHETLNGEIFLYNLRRLHKEISRDQKYLLDKKVLSLRVFVFTICSVHCERHDDQIGEDCQS